MIVYVESNFVLELALLQEQAANCEEILALGEEQKCQLVLPAFCIAEPHETLVRRAKERRKLAGELSKEIKLLTRTGTYKEEIDAMRDITGLLMRSADEERSRLHSAFHRILRLATLVPLTSEILADAVELESTVGLEPQDAIVYASVLRHLKASAVPASCFVNKNSKDFDDPDIEKALGELGCKLLFRFDSGSAYIRSRVSPASETSE